MSQDFDSNLDSDTIKRRERMRFLKKILRPMPRKSNMHRYPILKYFAETARKRTYLWEFRRRNVLAGIWVGWIVALIPIYSMQMLVAFLISIPARANCIIAMALQWVTNPITIPFILYGQYSLGDFILRTLGISEIKEDFGKILSEQGFYEVLDRLANAEVVIHVLAATLGGGFIIALLCASINTWIYLLLAKPPANSVKK